MTWTIAHRGASAEYPENTLAAFQRAIEVGADCLEVDVHLSREGIPVCRHDAAFGPDCTLLTDLYVEELRRRRGGQDIPTLEQVLQLDRGQVELFVELKGEECRWPKRFVETVVDLLSQFQHAEAPVPFLGSFSATILREVVHRWPSHRIIGIAEFESEIAPLMALRPAVMALDDKIATKQRIQDLGNQGVDVWVWTVDDLPRRRNLAAMGASGIITNCP